MIKRWRKILDERYQQWVERRIPAVKKIRLDNRKLFIFPTRAGFVFFILLVLLWLTATNFENNLIFAFAFLLTSLFIVTVFHTFLNLSGLQVSVGKATSGFSGQSVDIEYFLNQASQRQRYSIEISYPKSDPVVVSLIGKQFKTFNLSIPVNKRGWFFPQRITVKSVYPLGLLKVWTFLQFDTPALVYPQVVDTPLPVQVATTLGDNYSSLDHGREDFLGLETYRVGESLRHIAWKQFAREQGLYTKHYADTVDDKVWLDWETLPGIDAEGRLSRLCGWALCLNKTSLAYGLRLPGIELPPGSGSAHHDTVLRELALFALPQHSDGRP